MSVRLKSLDQKGTSRRLSSKRDNLLLKIQKEAKKQFGLDDFDPAVALAVVALKCLETERVVENGRVIGIIPPNRDLAVKAFSRVLPYVHARAVTVSVESEDGSKVAGSAKKKLEQQLQLLPPKGWSSDQGEGDEDR